jgi:hypothetical protein
MARLFAQFCTVVLAVAVLGGFLVGDAGHLVNGVPGGNVGGFTLHLTYARDAVDVLLLLAVGWVGFFASRHQGKVIMLAVGGVLVALGIVGMVRGDSTPAISSFNFPVAVNIFDWAIGVLAILSALGTLDDAEVEAAEKRSFLREG